MSRGTYNTGVKNVDIQKLRNKDKVERRSDLKKLCSTQYPEDYKLFDLVSFFCKLVYNNNIFSQFSFFFTLSSREWFVVRYGL